MKKLFLYASALALTMALPGTVMAQGLTMTNEVIPNSENEPRPVFPFPLHDRLLGTKPNSTLSSTTA